MKFKSLFTITLIAFSCVFILSSLTYAQTGWTKKSDVSGQPSTKRVKGGGGITALGNDVYLILGNNTLDFLKYNNETTRWLPVDSSVPIGSVNRRVKKGAYIVNDGQYIYVLKGGGTNEFFKYNPLDGIWDTLPSPGFRKGVKGGFACFVSYQGGKFIYAGSGSNTNEWKRFDIVNNLWETPSPETLPAHRVKIGSGLAYDNTSMIYFLLGGGRENDFYICDLGSGIATKQWVAKNDLPFYPPENLKKKKVKEGGCLEYAGGKIFAVKGGNTKGLWYYDKLADQWQYDGEIFGADSTPAEKGIKAGRSLTYSATAGGIFCIIGNNTNEFWFYNTATLPFSSNKSELAANSNVENTSSINLSSNSRIGTNFNHIQTNKSATNLKVYKITGELLFSGKVEEGNSSIGKLPVGVYIVRYEGKGYNEGTKLIVAR
jgi:hypothetical protein